MLRPASDLSDGERGADVDYSRIDRVIEVRAAAAAAVGGTEGAPGGTTTHHKRKASKHNINVNPSQCSAKAGRQIIYLLYNYTSLIKSLPLKLSYVLRNETILRAILDFASLSQPRHCNTKPLIEKTNLFGNRWF